VERGSDEWFVCQFWTDSVKEVQIGEVCICSDCSCCFWWCWEFKENLCMTRGRKLVVWESCDIIYLVGGYALW